MKNTKATGDGLDAAGREYAAAYGMHHMTKDLSKALLLYRRLVTAHPNAKEAGYAMSQIKSIERLGKSLRVLQTVPPATNSGTADAE